MSERIDYTQVAPRGVKALGGVHLYVTQSGLSPVLLATVYLRVSLINGCAYCIDMHSRELRELGVSNEKIALVPVWDEASELFDARERAALAWAKPLPGYRPPVRPTAHTRPYRHTSTTRNWST